MVLDLIDMKKRYILYALTIVLATGICCIINASVPLPVDDAYYQTGDEMRDLQARRAIDAYLAGDSITNSAHLPNAANAPCQPSIVFTAITDTTVTAIIHRCPAQ